MLSERRHYIFARALFIEVLELWDRARQPEYRLPAAIVRDRMRAYFRDRLRQALAEASRKSVPGILKALHSHILEELDGLRKALDKGLRAIQANYALKNGETERLLLYHSRVQHRISKWLSMLAQSKAGRLGLTITQPLETNGENGDGTFE